MVFLTLTLKIFTDRLLSELSTKLLNQVIASTKAFLNLTPDNNLPDNSLHVCDVTVYFVHYLIASHYQ